MSIINVPALFAVMATSDAQKLETTIRAQFPSDHYKIADGTWIIAANGTSKELSDKLGISSGSSSNGIVVRFTNYFGRAPNDLWEWIASRMVATNG